MARIYNTLYEIGVTDQAIQYNGPITRNGERWASLQRSFQAPGLPVKDTVQFTFHFKTIGNQLYLDNYNACLLKNPSPGEHPEVVMNCMVRNGKPTLEEAYESLCKLRGQMGQRKLMPVRRKRKPPNQRFKGPT